MKTNHRLATDLPPGERVVIRRTESHFLNGGANFRTIMAGLLLALALAACGGGGGGDSGGSVSEEPVPTESPQPDGFLKSWSGYFWAVATDEYGEHRGGAVLTKDGEGRLTVGSAFDGGSAQFVGHFRYGPKAAKGEGVIIGQACASDSPHRFCGASVPAIVKLAKAPFGEAVGEIRLLHSSGTEVWALRIYGPPTFFSAEGTLANIAGLYQPWDDDLGLLGDIGPDTTTSVDDFGRLFFQSAVTGCIANGTLVPLAEGGSNTYSVNLSIASCGSDRSYLNGDFEGLAVGPWHDSWDGEHLLMWLSMADSGAPPAAMTLLMQRF